jgi:hypothetical protein
VSSSSCGIAIQGIQSRPISTGKRGKTRENPEKVRH